MSVGDLYPKSGVKVALIPASIPGGGGGHVVRCLALARALEANGVVCTFVVEPLGVDILARLDWCGEVRRAEDQAGRLSAIRSMAPDAAVVDDYRLDGRFEAQLACPVMAIDDLADRPHACRLLLDSGYGRSESDYDVLAAGATMLLGPDYALLREGFAAPRRALAERVGRVFVSFGLGDVDGIAARAVALLRPLLPAAHFDVALGADAPSVRAIHAMADPGVELHLDADVAPLMYGADLGVGAGGGMVWERRAAGLPQLVVALADNQRPTTARLAAEGVIAALDLADPDFDTRLKGAFTRLLDPAFRRAQIDNPAARCDGQGAARAAQALLAALAQDSPRPSTSAG